MSTLTVTNISNGSVTTTTANVVNGCAKAWAKFNGSTGAVSASYNVSSVTVNGTGDFTINFTSALADANYSIAGFASQSAASAIVGVTGGSSFSQTTTTCRLYTRGTVNTTTPDIACVSFFR